MKTLTYNGTALSIKERLTISNLLSLFASRLNAKWISLNQGQSQTPNIVLVDADQAEGRQTLESATSRETLLPVTSDDRYPRPPFVARPIHAYGPNGVVVLFNAIAQALDAPVAKEVPGPRQEPAGMRMTGRMEAPAPAPVRTIRPPTPAPALKVPRELPLPPTSPPALVEAPAPTRVFVRWGPPEPVILPPLTQMPGARIHWFGRGSERRKSVNLPDISPLSNGTPLTSDPPAAPIPEAAPAIAWRAPEPETASPLVNMPIAHRPVEIHRPSVPVMGRARLEPPPPVKPAAKIDSETPVLRTSPPQWRPLEPEAEPELIDFRSLREVAPEPVSEPTPAPTPVEVETEPAEVLSESPIVEEPAVPEPVDYVVTVEDVPEETVETTFSDIAEGLETLSDAIAAEAISEEFVVGDPGADWWGTAQAELDGATAATPESPEGSLLNALKAIKASTQPSILEIAGLPAVCVIPARNIYFTTAPAARLESAMGSRTEVTWRTCTSEAEARQISGTEQSRQASLEQLCWTASLLNGAADFDSVADRAVRLRRWPPLTESRGRSKFVRYATLLSGAQATPRELAEITGDPLEEIVCFVNACSEMSLLETAGHSRVSVAAPPMRTQGAGILRGMIEQLTPPKL